MILFHINYIYQISLQIYTIDPTEHRVSTFTGNPQDLLPDFSLFTQGRYYRYIKSSKENGSFIRYYRTIINIEDQSPLAIIELYFRFLIY